MAKMDDDTLPYLNLIDQDLEEKMEEWRRRGGRDHDKILPWWDGLTDDEREYIIMSWGDDDKVTYAEEFNRGCLLMRQEARRRDSKYAAADRNRVCRYQTKEEIEEHRGADSRYGGHEYSAMLARHITHHRGVRGKWMLTVLDELAERVLGHDAKKMRRWRAYRLSTDRYEAVIGTIRHIAAEGSTTMREIRQEYRNLMLKTKMKPGSNCVVTYNKVPRTLHKPREENAVKRLAIAARLKCCIRRLPEVLITELFEYVEGTKMKNYEVEYMRTRKPPII